jgi:hypothetical protein
MKRSHLTLFLILIVLPIFAFMGLTYPRTVVSFPVSFSFGADNELEEFEVQALHGYVQVEVLVEDGSSLWNAQILREDEIVWSYSTHQGGQTVYKSEWIELSKGSYKFTYATAGLGSLDARIKVITKGGFW